MNNRWIVGLLIIEFRVCNANYASDTDPWIAWNKLMKENREGQTCKLAQPPFFLHLPQTLPNSHDISPLSLLRLLPPLLHHTHGTKAQSPGDFHLFHYKIIPLDFPSKLATHLVQIWGKIWMNQPHFGAKLELKCMPQVWPYTPALSCFNFL